MLALHLRANRKETVVGWYASAALGDEDNEEVPDLIANTSSLIHEFYAEESLKNSEPETLALHRMVADSKGKKDSEELVEQEPLLVSMEKLFNLLETASDYVDAVIDGKISPDAEVGRKVADTLATVPRIRPEVFDKLFNDSLQDLLMVTYLSNITQTQLSIAEKLNASLGV
jgi:translation initiation factor 3 subunit F